MKLLILRGFYRFFAFYLPVSNCRFNFFSKKIRYFLAKRLIKSCGFNVNFERRSTFSSLLSIGDNSGVGINCIITGETTIGSNVMMGPDCLIYTWNHNFEDRSKIIRLQGRESQRKVIIGDDVWIGARVIILPGIKIGTGAVIGAGSVVTKDIPDYAVAAGNPARVVRFRQ